MNFANVVLPAWERAMERFFHDVDRQQTRFGLSDDEVADALRTGYGDEVADAWVKWVAES